jgi:hypothetical protein
MTKTPGPLTIPEYCLPKQDLELIHRASEQMNMSLIEFIQLAPYLYARDLLSEKHDSRLRDPRAIQNLINAE